MGHSHLYISLKNKNKTQTSKQKNKINAAMMTEGNTIIYNVNIIVMTENSMEASNY